MMPASRIMEWKKQHNVSIVFCPSIHVCSSLSPLATTWYTTTKYK